MPTASGSIGIIIARGSRSHVCTMGPPEPPPPGRGSALSDDMGSAYSLVQVEYNVASQL